MFAQKSDVSVSWVPDITTSYSSICLNNFFLCRVLISQVCESSLQATFFFGWTFNKMFSASASNWKGFGQILAPRIVKADLRCDNFAQISISSKHIKNSLTIRQQDRISYHGHQTVTAQSPVFTHPIWQEFVVGMCEDFTSNPMWKLCLCTSDAVRWEHHIIYGFKWTFFPSGLRLFIQWKREICGSQANSCF